MYSTCGRLGACLFGLGGGVSSFQVAQNGGGGAVVVPYHTIFANIDSDSR